MYVAADLTIGFDFVRAVISFSEVKEWITSPIVHIVSI